MLRLGRPLLWIRVLRALKDFVKDCHVNVVIDNLAVMHAWNNQGGKGHAYAIDALFFTTMDLNILMHMLYVIFRLYTRIGDLE